MTPQRKTGIGIPLTCALSLLTTFAACKSGEKQETVKFGKGEVRYSEPVTEEEARTVGTILTEIAYLDNERPKTVVVAGSGDSRTVQFVVRNGTWDDNTIVLSFIGIGRLLASALGRDSIDVALIDEELKTHLEEPAANVGKRTVFGTNQWLYFAGAVTAEQSKAVGDLLLARQGLPKGSILQLAGGGGADYELTVWVVQGAWDDAAVRATWLAHGRKVAEALGADQLTVKLADAAMVPQHQFQAETPGARITEGRLELYYKGSATEAQARTALQALLRTGLARASNNRLTVQIVGREAGVELRFVLTGKHDDPEIVAAFGGMGRHVASYLELEQITVHLTDGELATKNSLKVERIGTPVALDANTVYYSGAATEADARKLGAALTEQGYFVNNPVPCASVTRSAAGAPPSVGLVMRDAPVSDAEKTALSRAFAPQAVDVQVTGLGLTEPRGEAIAVPAFGVVPQP